MPIRNLWPRFQFRHGIGEPAAGGEDGGEQGSRGDDGDAIAREAILEFDAEQGRGGRVGCEDCSDRRLNGRSQGSKIHRAGDSDIDAV